MEIALFHNLNLLRTKSEQIDSYTRLHAHADSERQMFYAAVANGPSTLLLRIVLIVHVANIF